jgi:electron transfer flavoprotein beta subunit
MKPWNGIIRELASACSIDLAERWGVKIVVCMKEVIDLSQLRFEADKRTPIRDGLPRVLGQFDKNALEGALRIKEAHEGVQVLALSAGVQKLRDTIKEALAMGADAAVLVTDPLLAGADFALSARVLTKAILKIGDVDLVLTGEGSDDEYTGQIPARVAAALGWPAITTVRELSLTDDARIRATRDLERHLEVLECPLPALVSVTSELNTPRLPPLTAILKAGRKPVQEWSLSDVLSESEPLKGQIEVRSNLAPAQEREGVMLAGDVEEQSRALIRALEGEGVLG